MPETNSTSVADGWTVADASGPFAIREPTDVDDSLRDRQQSTCWNATRAATAVAARNDRANAPVQF